MKQKEQEFKNPMCVFFLAPGTSKTATSTDLSYNKWMQKEKQRWNRNNGSD